MSRKLATTGMLTALSMALVFGACASVGGRQTTALGGDRDRIEQEELTAERYGSVLDAVRALRPQWLRQQRATSRSLSRTSPGFAEVMIYVDNTRMGGMNVLSGMQVSTVARLQYFSPSAAQMRFGDGHENGVILVVTRSAPR